MRATRVLQECLGDAFQPMHALRPQGVAACR